MKAPLNSTLPALVEAILHDSMIFYHSAPLIAVDMKEESSKHNEITRVDGSLTPQNGIHVPWILHGMSGRCPASNLTSEGDCEMFAQISICSNLWAADATFEASLEMMFPIFRKQHFV